ncbi:hypothetical protein [Duganella phyllosphaerae]|uniref:hypothetical protein n=1 Tax=Duganella phyllosphaerae TaxID=762836 RepID=UPI001428CD89|nr:hypothetical protein [Duganella phyllosphaerae]
MRAFIVKVRTATYTNTYTALAAHAADAQDEARDLHGVDCYIFVTPHHAVVQ